MTPLTPTALRALRNADDAAFELRHGRHLLRARRSLAVGGVHCSPLTELVLDGTVLDDARSDWFGVGYEAGVAFHRPFRRWLAPRTALARPTSWGSIARLLRVGDELALEWVVGADDGLAPLPPGYRRDELWLTIGRDGGWQCDDLQLLVAVSVAPAGHRWIEHVGPSRPPAASAPPDVQVFTAAVAAALAGTRRRTGTVLVAPDVAWGLPETLQIGPIRLAVQADLERHADEIVITERLRELGGKTDRAAQLVRTWVAPREVDEGGPAAVAAYTQLRADGIAPDLAAPTALAIVAM